MRLWGRRSAFNVQKALWTLGELGVPFEHVDAGGAAGGLDAPDFLARNPHGAIPVLEDGELVVWESHAIVRYLAAQYGRGTLWPEAPAPRSQADRWMDWSQCHLQVAFMELFWGFYRTPEAQRDEAAVERARVRCSRLYERLDAHLARHAFLGGDAFTMGDIPAGTSLHRYFEMGVQTPALPHLRAWHARLLERPAFCEHVAVPFDALRGRLSY